MIYKDNWCWSLITGSSLIIVWYLSIYLFELPRYFLPAPHEIFHALICEKKLLFDAFFQTLIPAVSGLVVSSILGALISLMLSLSGLIRKTLFPWVLLLQLVPIIVLTPIIAIWLGHGFLSIATITFLISFFPIVANTTHGLISTDKILVELLKTYRVSKFQEMFYLRIPYALPFYLTGLKISASLAMIGALTGELFVGSASGAKGLGYLIIIFRAQNKIPELFATAFIACLIGLIFVGIVCLINWLMLRKWHDSFR